jgi:hypothetical protein
VVFVAGGLSEEERITVPAAIAATGQASIVLLDTPLTRAHARVFVEAYRPDCLVPVGSFPKGTTDLEAALGMKVAPLLGLGPSCPTALQQALFPQAPRVIVAPPEPRRLLLQATCLAGALRAPLLLSRGSSEDAAAIKRAVNAWKCGEVFAVGGAYRVCHSLPDIPVVQLPDEDAVAAACLRQQQQHGPLRALVVANPADHRPGLGSLSTLAPWIAVSKNAALLLTNDQGTNVENIVRAALKQEALQRADAVILVGSLQAIPMDRRLNPIPGGKDDVIEMEPLTPTGNEPFSFAVGRLFHQDLGVVALLLAREQLRLDRPAGKALVVSNPGGSLPLLEAFSRSTAQELRNHGYDTTALFGGQARAEAIRRLLPEQDLFLWEGHHGTLVRDYGIPRWPEPLRPSLIFLQSCLALTEPKAQPFLERGAIGVIGTSTRTYSGSGGAFALAYFDALLYDRQTLGGALRQAKNFLLAFSLLKEKRLGEQAALAGASLRSAWAFTLWGDPTVRFPAPRLPPDHLEGVRHKVQGQTLIVSLPEERHMKVVTAKYQAEIRPNIRLAGLCSKEGEDECHRLIPLAFVEVELTGVPAGATPCLHSRLPTEAWVFLWDRRRGCGYLLVRPRASDHGDIRFHVSW